MILLATFGTLGDIHPFIAMAKALALRGLAPVIATSVKYRAHIEREDIAFTPMRPDESDIARALGIGIDEMLKRVVKSPFFIVDEIYLRFLSETFEDISSAGRGADAIITHSLLVGAGMAAERSGSPWLRVALSPIHLQSAVAPSLTPPLPYVLEPRWAAQRSFNQLLRQVLRARLACKLGRATAFRREIGLPPTREDLYLNCGSGSLASPIVGLYSPSFAPPARDHARTARIVGFPWHRSDRKGGHKLAPEVEAFLGAGSPPIVFTLGSFAVENAGSFYEESLVAARRLGRRALLLAGVRATPRLAAAAGPNMFVTDYAPHDLVFARAAAIVHHGGMGTTAEALRSGRPQLVVPFFGDQFDHAARITRLDVGRRLSHAAYDAENAATALAAIMTPSVEARTAAFSRQLADEDGAEIVADMIEARMTRRCA